MAAPEISSSRQRPTIRQIAELAGVSIATVSRVMNGREDVSSDTRRVVQSVAREHGYEPARGGRPGDRNRV
ncbi:MAG: LacI family DNA-binding transcriptional regulator [Acidimicrobiales bacterium]